MCYVNAAAIAAFTQLCTLALHSFYGLASRVVELWASKPYTDLNF